MDGYSFMSDTSQANTSEGNIEEGKQTRRSLFARAETFGKTEGKGDNSRPALFVLATEGSQSRILTEVKKPDKTDDADELFARYSQAIATAHGIGWKPQASAKQQVSKLRCAIKLGALTHVNGLEVVNHTLEALKEQRGANEGKNDYPPFDALVKVARFQISSPDQQISKEVIEGLIIKPAKDTPDEADRLEKVMQAAITLADAKEDPLSEESIDALSEAASTIMTRIRELGGSTKMRKQAAKAEEAKNQAVALVDLSRERAAKARAALEPDPKLVEYLAKRREELGTVPSAAE